MTATVSEHGMKSQMCNWRGGIELAKSEVDTRRKRPDAWAVQWDKCCPLILELTRPNDRDTLALQDTDTVKTALYSPPQDRLAMLPSLQGWTVEI